MDTVIGNETSISTNLADINVSINGTTNLSQIFEGTFDVIIADGNETVAEFTYTFNSTTNSTLDLSNITVQTQGANSTSGSLIISGIDLTSFGTTKTVYVDKLNVSMNAVCIKDAEVASISEVTSACTGSGEVKVECNGVSQSGFICSETDNGTRYMITGLVHSGITQISYTVPVSSSSSGGGGGGGAPGTNPVLIVTDIEKITTIKQGFITIFQIPLGQYRVKLTRAVFGYAELTDVANGKVYTFNNGVSKNIDLDNDGAADVIFTLTKAELGRGIFTYISPPMQPAQPLPVAQPDTEVPKEIAVGETQPQQEQNADAPSAPLQNTGENLPAKDKQSTNVGMIILLVVLLLGLFVAVLLVKKRRRL